MCPLALARTAAVSGTPVEDAPTPTPRARRRDRWRPPGWRPGRNRPQGRPPRTPPRRWRGARTRPQPCPRPPAADPSRCTDPSRAPRGAGPGRPRHGRATAGTRLPGARPVGRYTSMASSRPPVWAKTRLGRDSLGIGQRMDQRLRRVDPCHNADPQAPATAPRGVERMRLWAALGRRRLRRQISA
jgi:hypothetical protein